jgi:hypothetical protein
MKNITIKLTFFILLTSLFLTSCEEVVELDLKQGAPKLVIDASLKWQKGTLGNEQTITLSTTTAYYAQEVPAASGATVFVTNDAGTVFDFTEILTTGKYFCSNFIPEINQNYELTVIYKGETYTASEKLIAVPTIESVVQTENGGFTGDEVEVKFFFQDFPNEANFYLVNFNASNSILPIIDVIDDDFFQGNQMFAYLANELKPGDTIRLQLQGISKNYYNYMNVLLGISGNNGGSPFATPPATVRGNIINQSTTENFALGYFQLSEMDTKNYIVQ